MPTEGEIRAEVDRVVRSKAFETSEVHRRLLLYLVEKAISGEADRLKEYIVGVEAFGKPSTYDPRQDSIVRLQVGRLRQKLAAYYQSEANGDSVVIGLPKGGFKLNFEDAPAVAAAAPGPFSWSRTKWSIVGLAILAVWGIAATWLWLGARHEAAAGGRWTPELEALWSPFLESRRPLALCLGAPLFVRFPNYGFVRDPKTNDWAEVQGSARITAFSKALGQPDIYPSYGFTGMGEAGAGILLARLLSTRKPDLALAHSNLLSWQQILDDDVVFIGPPKFNTQLQAAALRQDIVVEAAGVRNLNPRPGEPEFLQDRMVAGKSAEGETHVLISRTPGLSGVGELLTVGGNASADTLAGAEWLTQPLRAKELVARLKGKSGVVPKYFQVVLRATFKQGVPVQSSYVFHHELGNAKP